MSKKYQDGGYQDITETGTGGLNGIPPVYEQENQENMSADDFMNFLKMRRNNISYGNIVSQASPTYAETPVGLASMELGVGDSKYDKRITNMQELDDLNEFRARQQSGWSQIANGIGKMATTFGTTFLSSTIGGIAGLGQGIANLIDDDQTTTFLSGAWNNKINQALAGFNQEMEEILPNYYTQHEQNAPWYKQVFTANFLGDKLIKNAGFMMGAAASMMAFGELGTALGVADKITKASGWLQKLGQVGQTAGKINGKVVPWLLTNFLSANGEASIEAVNSVKDNEKSLSQNVEEFTKRRNQEIQEEYMADVVSGMDYNQAIARHNQRLSSLNAEVAMYRTAMQEELTKAGNLVYGMNVVALMLTNGINMGSFIKGGYKNASRIFDNAALKIGEKTGGIKDFTRKELSEAILRGTLEADAGEIKRGAAKVAGRWLINSAAEGMQEGLQSEISTTNEILTQSRLNRYAIENNLTDSYINPATTDKYIDLSTAALKAWDEQFGSISSPGWEEVFIGALSAGIGMPFGRVESTVRKDNTLQKRFKFGWQGGVAEAIEDVYGDKRKLQAMSQTLNQKLKDPKQIDIIRKAIGNLSIEDAKDQAIENQDIRRYKNLEIAQAVTNALFYKDHGLLDAYLGTFEEFANNVSDADIDELYMATYSPDTKNSPLSIQQREETRKMYMDKARSTVDKIKNIIQNDGDLRTKFAKKFDGEHSEEAITELVYRKSLYDDTVRRKKELEEQLMHVGDKDDKMSKIEKADLKRSIEQLDKQEKELDEFINHAYENPDEYQNEIDKVREERIRYAISRDGQSAKLAYGTANDMGEIADIYYRGNQKDRDDILKQAVDETKDKNVKTRLREFQKFKENIDVMYDYVDKTYDELGNGPGITRMKESVKELLDEIVVDSLKDEGYILNTISDRIQHKIEDIDNEINDKVNGPNLYDENGRYIQVRDMDRLMMLQHLQSVFDGIKDEIEDVNDARDTGKNSDKVKSGEDWENMSDEEVVDAIFGDEEETGGAVIPEKENETNPETDKAVNKKTETWKEQSKTTEKETETKVTESENKNTQEQKEQEIVESEEDRVIPYYELDRQGVQGDVPSEVDSDYNEDSGYVANDSLKGNNFAPYTRNGLQDGRLNEVPDKQKIISQSDKVKIQRFIDKYMQKWLDETKGKDQKIRFITHDEHPEIIYLAVRKGECAGFIKNYGDLLVVSANNEYNVSEDYVIIGTLGYYNPGKNPTKSQLASYNAQKRTFNIIRDGLFKEHENFEGYHVSKHTTTVKGFTDGFKIHDRQNKNSLKDLLEGDRKQFTNPSGLTVDNMKISYITGNEDQGYIEKFIRFNHSDKRVALTYESMQPGRVFVYVPTNKGYYMPMFVETMRFNDWFDGNRNTDLAKDIVKTLENLAESHPGEDDRSNSLKDLYNLLVFSGDDYLAFVDIKRKNKITGQQEVIGGVVRQGSGLGSRVLYKQFVDDMEVVALADIDQIQGEEPEIINEKFEILLNAIYQINPRIALNSALLDTNIGYYIDSNVLQTDFEVLGTMGSSFYVNPLDENMNVIETKDNDGFRNDFTSSPRKNNDVAIYVPMNINGKTVSSQYWFNPYENKLYDANKVEIPYQGNEELYVISNVVYSEMNQNLIPSFKINEAKYFEVGDNVVRKNVRSYEVLSESDKRDYFDKKQKLIEQEQKRKAKEEAEKAASEVVEDIHDVEPVLGDNAEEFYLKQDVDDYVNDLIAHGTNRESIVVEHHPETETEDEYWTVSIKQEKQSTKEIDKQVVEFIEKAVSLQLESEEENKKMKNIKSELRDDESQLYEFGKQFVDDIDDLNANDALHALLREIYKKQSFQGNYASFRQAILNLDDETVQKDILNCK